MASTQVLHRRAAVLVRVGVLVLSGLVVLRAVGEVAIMEQVLDVLQQLGPPGEDGYTNKDHQ